MLVNRELLIVTQYHLITIFTLKMLFFSQVLAIEAKNLEATKLKILQLVCRGSRYEEAAVSLRRFFVELERAEPKVIAQNNVLHLILYYYVNTSTFRLWIY